MSRFHAQQGLTLVELLLGLAITAVVMAPLAVMFQGAAESNIAARAALDLNSDARFALDRIALRAATAASVSDGTGVIVQPVTTPPPAGQAAAQALTYAIVGSNLVETQSAGPAPTLVGALVGAIGTILAPTPANANVIASNVTAFKLTAPATTGQALLKIDLTLVAPGGASVVASRTVRVGSQS